MMKYFILTYVVRDTGESCARNVIYMAKSGIPNSIKMVQINAYPALTYSLS